MRYILLTLIMVAGIAGTASAQDRVSYSESIDIHVTSYKPSEVTISIVARPYELSGVITQSVVQIYIFKDMDNDGDPDSVLVMLEDRGRMTSQKQYSRNEQLENKFVIAKRLLRPVRDLNFQLSAKDRKEILIEFLP